MLALQYMQILLFNCMSVRDPCLLLPRLRTKCTDQGLFYVMRLGFHKKPLNKMLFYFPFKKMMLFNSNDM